MGISKHSSCHTGFWVESIGYVLPTSLPSQKIITKGELAAPNQWRKRKSLQRSISKKSDQRVLCSSIILSSCRIFKANIILPVTSLRIPLQTRRTRRLIDVTGRTSTVRQNPSLRLTSDNNFLVGLFTIVDAIFCDIMIFLSDRSGGIRLSTCAI